MDRVEAPGRAAGSLAAPSTHQSADQHHAGDEPTDVRVPRDPRTTGPGGEDLDNEPEAEEDHRRQVHDANENNQEHQRQDLGAGIEDQGGTENTGDEPMVFIAFHQIPGTHLPVPASWQYHADDLAEHESIDSRIAKMANEDPAAMDSATLYSWRQHLLHELGVLDDEFNLRRKAKNYLVPPDQDPWETPADSQTVTLIAPELGFDIHTLQLSVRVVPPGHTDDTFHRHGEAVHYYLSGQGDQIVGEETIAVETGDLVFIPAGTAHGIKNSADGPMRVLVAEQLPGTYLQRPVIKSDSD